MSRKFSLYKDYYDNGYPLYKKKHIEIQEGVTVLVGCNGIGKSTLLHQIKDHLKEDKIPYVLFDNLTEGGGHARQRSLHSGDFNFLATAVMSSEGENIIMNMNELAARLGYFVKEGMDPDKTSKMEKAFLSIFEEKKEDSVLSDERWILLDAVDSGLSVDNIVDLKEQLFQTILTHNFGKTIYIVISANEYEMARGEQCFDVYNGKYTTLKDYEEYRQLILDSKEWKKERQNIPIKKTKKQIEFEEKVENQQSSIDRFKKLKEKTKAIRDKQKENAMEKTQEPIKWEMKFINDLEDYDID